jgi:acetyl esterase/lipase
MPELDLARRIVYSVDGMADVAPTRHVYARAGAAELLMDVYAPPRAGHQDGFPALCFVHGGPIPPTMLPPREWGVFQSYGQLAAMSGLVGVVFNHCLFAPTAYETAEGDVKSAVDYVRANASAIGIDPDRIGLWAFSGGGPLLSWCLRERPSFVRCLIAFYALLDLRHLVPSGADDAQSERMRRFSPAAHLDVNAALPPLFVARAGQDMPAINTGIDVFVRDALAANAGLDLLTHPQGHHGFDILDDDARSRDIIERAIAFAKARLR